MHRKDQPAKLHMFPPDHQTRQHTAVEVHHMAAVPEAVEVMEAEVATEAAVVTAAVDTAAVVTEVVADIAVEVHHHMAAAAVTDIHPMVRATLIQSPSQPTKLVMKQLNL